MVFNRELNKTLLMLTQGFIVAKDLRPEAWPPKNRNISQKSNEKESDLRFNDTFSHTILRYRSRSNIQ